MKKSLSAASKHGCSLLILFCLFHFYATGQGKAVIEKKPDATISENKTVKSKQVRTHKHLKKQKAPTRRAFDNPSDNDKKLKEIKEAKSKLRKGK